MRGKTAEQKRRARARATIAPSQAPEEVALRLADRELRAATRAAEAATRTMTAGPQHARAVAAAFAAYRDALGAAESARRARAAGAIADVTSVHEARVAPEPTP